MTRIVVATFPDAGAARRAAAALGRAELAAGPTRVRVDASAPERAARLELRVDEPDAPRAIALMREHGAAVADREELRHDTRGRGPATRGHGPLAAVGMAIADAATAAMAGATASDEQVPASTAPREGEGAGAIEGEAPAALEGEAPTALEGERPAAITGEAPASIEREAPAAREAGAPPPTIVGNAPSRSRAGSGSGTHLSDTVAAGTASSMGQVGPGSTLAAAMGATDETGTASGTHTRAEPGTLERADDVPPRDPRPPRRRPRSDA